MISQNQAEKRVASLLPPNPLYSRLSFFFALIGWVITLLLIFSIRSIFFLGPLYSILFLFIWASVTIALGHMGHKKQKRNWMAMFGLLLGYPLLILALLDILIILFYQSIQRLI
ncbi:MAG TPA: hypothetical protein VFN35_06915 [Ktedonobacteraceae bacterium]|nr:hypothetical protein [Ktedonobacteraceae bacterium]